jgi:hypothetical protein
MTTEAIDVSPALVAASQGAGLPPGATDPAGGGVESRGGAVV